MLVKGLYIFTDKNPKQTQNNPKTHQKNPKTFTKKPKPNIRSLNWRNLIKVMYSIIQTLEETNPIHSDRYDKFSPLLLQRTPAL